MANGESMAGAGPGYTIGVQQQKRDYTPGGGITYSWVIPLTFPDGTQAEITVPQDQYNPAYVHAQAAELAARVAAVSGLPHTLTPDQRATIEANKPY